LKLNYNKMDAMYFFNKGNEKGKTNDFIGAIKDYSTAIKLTSGIKNMDIPEKLEDGTIVHTPIIEFSEGMGEIYFNRGMAYIMVQNYKCAISDFTQIIEFQPNDAEAYFKRAIANYCLQNDDEVREDIAKANSIDSKYTVELLMSIFEG